MTFIQIPPVTSWRDPVSTLSALPTGGNLTGDAIITQDTQTIYIWNGSAWVAASGGGGTVPSASIKTVSSSPYTVVSTDIYLLVNTGSAITINLPNPNTYRRLIIKDSTGTAFTNNITLHRNGSENIENLAADKTLAANYGSVTLWADGTNWWME